MKVFAAEKRKKFYKVKFLVVFLIAIVVVSFSMGLLTGYLASQYEEKDNHARIRGVEELEEIFSAEHMKNTTRYVRY